MNSQTKVYLRPDVVMEPLVNRWYAWPYLVSPFTAAMFAANHHVRILQSFVRTPQLHVVALQKPDMRGGPFVHYPVERAKEIEALLDATRAQQADLLEVASALAAVNELLARESGASLEVLYAQIPPVLRGYVELVYDLRHRPDLRVLEALAYRGPLYKRDNQAISLLVTKDDERSFALSTPRLEEPENATVAVPFVSAVVDELSRARTTAKPFGFFEDMLRGRTDRDIGRFFTETVPASSGPLGAPDDGMTIRYFGHASVLATSGGTSVMFDPMVPYKHGGGEVSRYGFDDLPEVIDWVVLTHNHPDHVVLESLLQMRHRIRSLVVPANTRGSLADPSLKLMFNQLGFRDVRSIEDLEVIEIAGGSLTALPFLGEHGDLDVRSKSSYVLRLGGRTVVCAADSNNIEPRLYDHLRDIVGPVDALFIGMECQGAPVSWFYGPLFASPVVRKHDETRRLNGSDCARALGMVDALKPARVYVYAMAMEPWLGFISSIRYDDGSLPIVESNRLVDECRGRGLVAERLCGAREIVLRR